MDRRTQLTNLLAAKQRFLLNPDASQAAKEVAQGHIDQILEAMKNESL